MVELLKFEGKHLGTFSKCEECTQGDWIKEHHPVPGLDNDVFSLMIQYTKIKKPKIEYKENNVKKEVVKKLIKPKLKEKQSGKEISEGERSGRGKKLLFGKGCTFNCKVRRSNTICR